MQGGLLALDVATVTGWAYGRVPVSAATSTFPPKPESGAIMLPGGLAVGSLLAKFEDELGALIIRLAPKGMIIEAPILPKFTSHETVRKLMSLAGIAEKLAYQHCIRRRYVVQPAQVKKHWTGKGNAKKPDMVAACEARGWAVSVHDEADALAIWDLGCAMYRKEMGR